MPPRSKTVLKAFQTPRPPSRGRDHYPHFTSEETDATRFSNWPRTHSGEQGRTWDLNQGLCDSRPIFFLYFPTRSQTDSVNTQITVQGSGAQAWCLPPKTQVYNWKDQRTSRPHARPHSPCVCVSPGTA